MTNIQILKLFSLVYLALISTWIAYSLHNENNANAKEPIYFKDLNGGNLVNITSTNEGDLWIYNAGDKEIIFVENPTQSKQINIVRKALD